MRHKIDWWQVLCIGFFPPLWAVASSILSVRTGAVALICAGLYAMNGKRKDAANITAGLFAGDLWAGTAVILQSWLSVKPEIGMFITLCFMGMLAVLISGAFSDYISCPAWLSGWAIGLTVLGENGLTYGIKYMLALQGQIAVSMFVGVWYVGVFAEYIHTLLEKKIYCFKKEYKS